MVLPLEDRCLLSTFLVNNNTVDDANTQGTLRWAVAQANVATTPSSIEIELGTIAATITLGQGQGQGQLELSNTNDAVTIYNGPGQGPVSISGNHATGVFVVDGGVTANFSGLTITGGSANYGGGLSNSGTATLSGCTIFGNSAKYTGGGITNGLGLAHTETLTLIDCTVSGNTAYFQSNGLAGGSGGGVCSNGQLNLVNSDFFGNYAYYGGGLDNLDNATLTNCTLSGNTAGNEGGGLLNSFRATLNNCTISGNAAGKVCGGLFSYPGSSTLNDSIVADNSLKGGGASDVATANGGTVSGSHDLIGTGGSGGLANNVNGNLVGVTNLDLGTLGYYGGPTETFPLLAGSPAIAAGSAAGGVTTDQRGQPLDYPTPDIGAFQSTRWWSTPRSMASSPRSAT